MAKSKKNKPDNDYKPNPLNDKELIRKKSKSKTYSPSRPPQVNEK